jgi:hypothetical protein
MTSNFRGSNNPWFLRTKSKFLKTGGETQLFYQ